MVDIGIVFYSIKKYTPPNSKTTITIDLIREAFKDLSLSRQNTTREEGEV